MAGLTFRERLDPRRFFRGEKAVDGPIQLDHRRVFILPNRRGWALALLLTIQVLTATQYSNNLTFILTFLLASIALLGILYGFRNLAGIRLRRGRVSPVFVGEKAHFELHIDNPTTAPRLAIVLTLEQSPKLTIHLPPGESLTIPLPVPAERRGWLNLPTVTLSSTFPLGLFRAWSPVNLKQRVLVYPRPSPDPLPFPEHPGTEGHRLDHDDFHGFQSYQPGDPLRHIHWKGVAKGQGVHIKEYRGAEHHELLFDWVLTPGKDTEAKLSRLCRWVIDAESAGIPYSLRIPGLSVLPGRGPLHMSRCLEGLALFGTGL
ncbi:DUF58 domain-containing protein [Methylococcus sp. EFPC2]|uniref:DUF58 domain-containing protein n=1 Tax=Methylococcus sp. EFPC2 TaxID=2812648 RepID=UPI001967655A|nr:DUF58 domain-containing protein [Methylococcus sp. EFPC2]QSA96483.1 DUF58 domain-containing protein [Methylococcus sp. EFPC2]